MRPLFLTLLLGCPAGTDGSTTDTDTDHSGTSETHTGVPSGDEPLTPEDVITSRNLSGLRLEIDWVTGREPKPEVLDLVAGELERLRSGGQIVKPLGVQITLDQELPPTGADINTFAVLSQLVYDNAGPLREDDTAVVHILYVDGGYERDNDVTTTLGFAWGGSWLVMLADNIEDGCATELSEVKPGDQDLACTVAETSVLMHELGHLFGLVNNGVPMATPHEDPDHTHHDVEQSCLMYWLMNGSGALGEVGGRFGRGDISVPRYDAACEADMAAFQQ